MPFPTTDHGIALLHFPFDVVLFVLRLALYASPAGRPTPAWSYRQALQVSVVALLAKYGALLKVAPRLSLRAGSEKERFVVIEPAPPDHYRGPATDPVIKPVPIGLTWTPAVPSAKHVSSSSPVALHLHGGAYTLFTGRDEDSAFVARTLLRDVGCSFVCLPQYRLASSEDGYFPAALQDAITAYHYLVGQMNIPPSSIVLSGDSAGGNLALALVRYIESQDEPSLPAAIALWSPWVDVEDALRSAVESKPRYATDYLCTSFSSWGAKALTRDGTIDASNAYLSPLHKPFRLRNGRVPMFIQTGECEVLCDDNMLLADRFREAGWPVKLVVSPACPHDIIMFGSVMGFRKELKAAAETARRFILESTHLHLGT